RVNDDNCTEQARMSIQQHLFEPRTFFLVLAAGSFIHVDLHDFIAVALGVFTYLLFLTFEAPTLGLLFTGHTDIRSRFFVCHSASPLPSLEDASFSAFTRIKTRARMWQSSSTAFTSTGDSTKPFV